MDDLIKRKDAILMIQRHGVGCFDQEDFYPEEAERFVISMLEKLSSAEPEIIHCRDCDMYLGDARCVHNDDLWDEDDYCSHAERRK